MIELRFDSGTGKIKPGEVSIVMFSGMDRFPTLLAAAGDAEVLWAHPEYRTRSIPPRRGGPSGVSNSLLLDGAGNGVMYRFVCVDDLNIQVEHAETAGPAPRNRDVPTRNARQGRRCR
ncbi:hypothetical protein EAH78_20535 [Pseudomonas arsenicoxydans]|uniref:Uncharacterized protein n=1 Tax=Pseudomonas arsenicoxydans TaxID=702115 RepID=A0A502HQ13_9PSED|nr:hypothetical protein EAH78_20535 [Pseudomonas arsenicoxydans]